MMTLMKNCNRQRLIALAIVFALGILGLGISSIAEQLHEQPRKQAALIATMTTWSESLSLEIPAIQRNDWRNVAAAHPEQFIAACTIQPR